MSSQPPSVWSTRVSPEFSYCKVSARQLSSICNTAVLKGILGNTTSEESPLWPPSSRQDSGVRHLPAWCLCSAGSGWAPAQGEKPDAGWFGWSPWSCSRGGCCWRTLPRWLAAGCTSLLHHNRGKLCVKTESLHQVLSSVAFVDAGLWAFRSRAGFAVSLSDLPPVASYRELWWVREQEAAEGRRSCEEWEGEQRWAAARWSCPWPACAGRPPPSCGWQTSCKLAPRSPGLSPDPGPEMGKRLSEYILLC